MWICLGILAIILLVIYFRKSKNAVWGGLTIGIIIGILTVIIWEIMGKGFHFSVIAKVSIATTLAGFIAEMLPLIWKKIFKD